MAQMVISAQEITNKKDSLVLLNRSLGNQISQLETLGNNLNTMWEGAAKESYMKCFRVDLAKMKTFFKAIEEFINILTKIIQIYNMMEQKNMATASS